MQGPWISIHATTQVATGVGAVKTLFETISIHATTQVATSSIQRTGATAGISIHATTQVATLEKGILKGTGKFQSTPPRRWRRIRHSKAGAYGKISIHATTQVAT